MPRSDTPLNQQLDKAVALYRAGDLAQAQTLCAHALASQPNHARALHLAGMIAKQAGDLPAANDFLARANLAEAHNPFILRDLAEAQRLLGQHEQALSSLEQAIHRAPDMPDLFSALGLTCEAMGHIDAAIRAHTRVTELLPQHAGAQTDLKLAIKKRTEAPQPKTGQGNVVNLTEEQKNSVFLLQAERAAQEAFENGVWRNAKILTGQKRETVFSQPEVELGLRELGVKAFPSCIDYLT